MYRDHVSRARKDYLDVRISVRVCGCVVRVYVVANSVRGLLVKETVVEEHLQRSSNESIKNKNKAKTTKSKERTTKTQQMPERIGRKDAGTRREQIYAVRLDQTTFNRVAKK